MRRNAEPPASLILAPDAHTSLPLPSVEAFRRALGSLPVSSSWRNLTVCLWNARELDQYDLSPMDELIVNLHTEGAPVRTRLARGWSHEMPTGHLHLIPPSVPTAWKVGRELGFVSIHLPVSRIEGLTDDADQARRCMEEMRFRFGVRDQLLAAAAAALAREVRQPGERGSLYADHLADTILLHVLRNRSAAENDRRRLARGGLSSRALRIVRERIEGSLELGVTLADLAREVGLSRAHFARAFKDSMGITPHRFMTSRRIERAKGLLLRTDQPLADVAFEVGFSSQAHFTDQFRRVTGSTPLRFRLRR
jgi:AraC family transcriptional regulator